MSLTSLCFSFNTRLIIYRHGPGSRIPPSQQSTLSTKQQSHAALCSLWFDESYGPCKQLTVAQVGNYSWSSCLTPGRRTLFYRGTLRREFDCFFLLHTGQGEDRARVSLIQTTTPTCKLSLWLHCGRAVDCLLSHTSMRTLGSGSWLDRASFLETLLRLGDGYGFRHIPAKVQFSLLACSRQLAIQCQGFPTHLHESPLFGVQSCVLRLMVSHLVRRFLRSSDIALINNATVTDKLFWSHKHPFTFALLSD